MIKKQSVAALVLFLLIPLVLALGGLLFSLINPEIASGHPNYVRNYHLLNLLRNISFWASLACAAVLWLLVCLLVIRSKKRSWLWLFLAALGPVGFAILAMLNDKELSQPDMHTRFVQTMRWYVRVAYELCVFAIVCVFAYELMVLKRTLMIWFEAATTGVSTTQIINLQNASSGMWAFAEGNEVMFLAVLLYLLWPLVFRLIGDTAARNASAAKLPGETGL
ncbi:MAG: hypothetical protein WBF42_16185 [Terracidiphilus sp.]